MGPRARSEEDRELRKLLVRASVYPVVTALAVVGVLGWLLLRQARIAAWVDHADVAIARGSEVGLLLIERETSLRGYRLSGEPELLRAYRDADRRLPEKLDALEAFVADDAPQVERVRRIRALASAWGQEARQALSEGWKPVLSDSERARLDARRGLQERTRSELAAFTGLETSLRAERAGRAREAQRVVLAATLALGLATTITARAQLRRVARTFRRAATAAQERGRALRESEERFRLFVEGVHDAAIYMLDPEERVRSWNAGAERIQGYAPYEVLGHAVGMFCPCERCGGRRPRPAARAGGARGAGGGRELARSQGRDALLGERHGSGPPRRRRAARRVRQARARHDGAQARRDAPRRRARGREGARRREIRARPRCRARVPRARGRRRVRGRNRRRRERCARGRCRARCRAPRRDMANSAGGPRRRARSRVRVCLGGTRRRLADDRELRLSGVHG